MKSSSTLTIKSSVFDGCFSYGDAACISSWDKGTIVTIQDTMFRNFVARGSSCVKAVGVSSVTLTNVTFTSGLIYNGGALAIIGPLDNTVQVADMVCKKITASNGAGACLSGKKPIF